MPADPTLGTGAILESDGLPEQALRDMMRLHHPGPGIIVILLKRTQTAHRRGALRKALTGRTVRDTFTPARVRQSVRRARILSATR